MSKDVVKNKVGRPTRYEPAVVNKLKAAFANAFTVDQACIYAGISKETFYNWSEKHPGFVDQITKAKEQPTMAAKRNVVDAVTAGDIKTSRWWLERKAPEEFARAQHNSPAVIMNFNQAAKDERNEFNAIDAL